LHLFLKTKNKKNEKDNFCHRIRSVKEILEKKFCCFCLLRWVKELYRWEKAFKLTSKVV